MALAMVSELPPFPGEENPPIPPFDESSDTLTQHQTEAVSPSSRGLLESIAHPPKNLEGTENPNSMNPNETRLDDEKNEDLNQREEETNVEPDTETNHANKYDNDTEEDSLFALVHKFLFPDS